MAAGVFQRDNPLLDPDGCGDSEDKLGRKDEAKELAEMLWKNMGRSQEPFVLAINGPWGSGKTTFGEFVVYYLQSRPENDRPHVMRYDPWLYSGRGRLVIDFLGALERHVGSDQQAFGDLWEYVRRLALTLVARAQPPDERNRDESPEVLRAREDVADRLRERGRRIVVLLDDVDRLIRDELRVFLWLLKMVADLPCICYVVMCDCALVASMISDDFPGRGNDYVARIINATFDLRRPSPARMLKILLQYIGKAVSGNEKAVDAVWQAGLGQLVSTLRHAKRLANAVDLRLAVSSDKDFQLLLAVEGL